MCVKFLFEDLNFDLYPLKLYKNLYLWTTPSIVCNSDLFIYLLLFFCFGFVFFSFEWIIYFCGGELNLQEYDIYIYIYIKKRYQPMDSCMGAFTFTFPFFSLKNTNPSLSFQANSNKQPTSSSSSFSSFSSSSFSLSPHDFWV